MENHLRLYLFHSLLWCFSFIIFNFFRLWNLIMDLSNYNSPFPPISLIHFPYYPYHHTHNSGIIEFIFIFFTFSIYIIIMNKSILLELTFSRRWVSRCWIFYDSLADLHSIAIIHNFLLTFSIFKKNVRMAIILLHALYVFFILGNWWNTKHSNAGGFL